MRRCHCEPEAKVPLKPCGYQREKVSVQYAYTMHFGLNFLHERTLVM